MAKGTLVSLFSLHHLIACLLADEISTAFLQAVPGQEITAFQAVVTKGSKLDCVTECMKYSHCTSVVFFPSTKMCYLEPSVQVASAAGASAVTVWEKEGAICRDAPSFAVTNGNVASVRRTMTSVAAPVTCDADFLWTGSDAGIECLSDGTWTTDETCKRYHWTNQVTNLRTRRFYSVPRPPLLTWKMCLRGTPQRKETGYTAFTIEIYDSSYSNRFVRGIIKFDPISPRTELSNVFSGKWTNGKVVRDNFPFTLDQEFLLVVSAASEYALNISVDGTFYTDLRTPVSVTKIRALKLWGTYNDFFPDDINMWCT